NVASTGPVGAPYFPLDAGPVSINPYPNVITVSTLSVVAPGGALPGAANVPMMKLTLNTDVSQAQWLSLRVDRSGTSQDLDVAAVKLWYDINDIGSFDPGNLGQYLLVTKGTETFGSQGTPGSVVLGLLPSQALTAAARRFFVTMDLAAGAAPGRTVGVRALDQSYFAANAPNSFAPAGFDSAALSVTAPAENLYVLAYDSAPAAALQGTSNVPMLSLAMWMGGFTGQFSQMTLRLTGTGADADVARVKLYYDAPGTGVLDIVHDTLVSSGVFSGGQLTLSFPAQTVDAATRTYFVTCDVSQTASAGDRVGVSIPSAGSIYVALPNTAVLVSAAQSSDMLVSPTQNGVYAAAQDRAPGSLMQGATNQLMLTLSLNTTSNAVLVSAVAFQRLGTASDSDVAALRVYYDADGSGQIGGQAVPVATLLNPFSGGAAVAGLSPPQPVGTSVRRYLVALDLADFADYSKTLGVGVASAGSFTVPAPNYAVDAGFPMNSSAVPIAKRPDTLTVSPAAVLPAAVIQGQRVAAARLSAWSSRSKSVWNRLRLSKLGSLAESGVEEAGLYRDSDGDGTLSGGDLLVGSAAFSGGQAVIDFSSAQTVGLSTITYFAALKLKADAAVGATLGVSIPDAGYLRVASPDLVSLTQAPFSTVLASVLDGRTPSTPLVVLLDGSFSSSFESLRFVWSSTVALGGISSASYCVGATPGGAEVLPWTAMSPTPGGMTVGGLLLLNGITYYVSARATSTSGFASPVGVSAGQMVDAAVPPPPAVPTAQVGQNSIMVNWAPVAAGASGLLGYLVEYSKVDVPLWRNAKSGVGASALGPKAVTAADVVQPPFAFVNPPPGTLLLRASAVSGAGVAGPPSEPVKIQFGALPPGAISGVSVYPNPFDSRKGAATIVYTLPVAAQVDIGIYDVFGTRVKAMSLAGQAGTNAATWDGTDETGRKVSMGGYLCRIKSGGASVVSKIGVIH
ncbi:MAG: FlgD immunoglobulin-like domain containing protein, partial [Elusimicrobia bacterium]|nr:FlgD immunoglobulin-like domain containing protein [Elusimicrobiota bacterium]